MSSRIDEEGNVQSIGRAAAAEFLGTLGLVFIGAGAVMSGEVGLEATGIALASGLAVTAMMIGAASFSGGHLNPAITIGALVARRIDALTAAVYVVVQLLGAAIAALLLRALLPGIVYDAAAGGLPELAPGYAVGKALGIEAIVTALLVIAYLVVASVSENRRTAATPGVAVGLIVVAGNLAFKSYTGAAFNPARWFGPAFASANWADGVVWIVGPAVGGLLAGGIALLSTRGRKAAVAPGAPDAG